MARKHKHEEHQNHEAWAIPYGDLITLLLAFFVVMYAVSSVNEGKYRVLADSLSSALGGPPRTLKPIQVGNRPEKGTQTESLFNTVTLRGFEQERSGLVADAPGARMGGEEFEPGREDNKGETAGARQLRQVAAEVQAAMKDLIDRKLVMVRRTEQSLEIEINTDILFASGVAAVSQRARPVLTQLAGIMQPFDSKLRIEGHTDNQPISTIAYPSNWELSAARAASVVHLFAQQGVDAGRMTVVGMGEYHPVASNDTAEGRNRNRRVVVVVVADENSRQLAGADVTAATTVPHPPTASVEVPAGTLDQLQGGAAP